MLVAGLVDLGSTWMFLMCFISPYRFLGSMNSFLRSTLGFDNSDQHAGSWFGRFRVNFDVVDVFHIFHICFWDPSL